MVYGKVYKQQYAITKRIGNGSAVYQALFFAPATYKKLGLGFFRPRNLLKTGPGDEATQ